MTVSRYLSKMFYINGNQKIAWVITLRQNKPSNKDYNKT